MKCVVCEHEFEAKKENKYIVEKTEHQLLGGAYVYSYECFDCPVCGCQNVAQARVENHKPNEIAQ